MRKVMGTLSIVFFMMSLAPSLLRAQQQVFERPTYAVGDTWEYAYRNGKTNTFKVIEVSETGFVVIDNDNNRFEHDRDGNRIVPGWRWLSFPMQVGKKWKFEIVPPGANPGVSLLMDAHVKKLVTITTKAGTFEALVIEGCWTRMDNPRLSGCDQTYWYAPKIKRLVKRESSAGSRIRDNDYELVSYTLAGQ